MGNDIKKKNVSTIIGRNEIKAKIIVLREQQVILDKDIAKLYDVKPIRLREQVQRNIERFPIDFMFRLTETEVDLLVSQNAIPSRKHLGGSLPYVFTEQGVASLSGVLKSAKASSVHVQIMRTFVEMRRFIQNSGNVFARLESVENRQIEYENKTGENVEKVFQALESNDLPAKGIFYQGQVFDAYKFVNDLIRKAEQSLIIIDNYIDDSVLMMLTKRKKNVSVQVYTKKISKQLILDLDKHNSQYPKVTIEKFNLTHDRFIIIDKKEIYHIGASLKDLGKKWFAFSQFGNDAVNMLKKLEDTK